MGFSFSNRLYLELLRIRIFVHIGYLRSTFSFDLFQSCLNCQKSGLISPGYFYSWFYPIELQWIEKDQLIIFFFRSALELIGRFQSNTTVYADWFDMFVDTCSWSWIVCIPAALRFEQLYALQIVFQDSRISCVWGWRYQLCLFIVKEITPKSRYSTKGKFRMTLSKLVENLISMWTLVWTKKIKDPSVWRRCVFHIKEGS